MTSLEQLNLIYNRATYGVDADRRDEIEAWCGVAFPLTKQDSYMAKIHPRLVPVDFAPDTEAEVLYAMRFLFERQRDATQYWRNQHDRMAHATDVPEADDEA